MRTPKTQTLQSEELRVAALRRLRILGTEPEEAFDQVVALAADHYDCSCGFFALIGDQQCWVKASHGFSLGTVARERSLFSETIAESGPTVYTDLSRTPGLAENDLVTGSAALRFYAGVPVVIDEQPIGVLCVCDRRPREISKRALGFLEDTAGVARALLEYRRVDLDLARLLKAAAACKQEKTRDGEAYFRSLARNFTALLPPETRQAAASAVAEAQRAQSLESLTLGAVHDLNNLLVPILGHASYGVAHTNHGSPLGRRLQDISVAAERASELAKQLVCYCGPPAVESQRVLLTSLVKDMQVLLRSSIPRKVNLEIELGSDLPSTNGNEAEIRQIAVNLVLNAADAIHPHAGVIRIRTQLYVVDGAEMETALIASEAGPGTYVCLTVEDTGHGIAPATRSRMLTPFFSTKAGGRGLGMPCVAAVIERHGGGLLLTSAPGEGARFHVLFRPTG